MHNNLSTYGTKINQIHFTENIYNRRAYFLFLGLISSFNIFSFFFAFLPNLCYESTCNFWLLAHTFFSLLAFFCKLVQRSIFYLCFVVSRQELSSKTDSQTSEFFFPFLLVCNTVHVVQLSGYNTGRLNVRYILVMKWMWLLTQNKMIFASVK